MKRHAVALRAFTHADDSFVKGQTILGMEPGHFADWSTEGIDLVRAATEDEVAAARGEKAPAKPSVKRKATSVPAAPAILSATAPTPATPVEPS